MTLACSSAILNVSSENVVHSIDRNKISSASLGGACRAIMEGRGPRNAGKTYITFFQLKLFKKVQCSLHGKHCQLSVQL